MIPGAHWLYCLIYLASSRSVKDSAKKLKWMTSKERYPRLTSGLAHAFTYMYMCAHIHRSLIRREESEREGGGGIDIIPEPESTISIYLRIQRRSQNIQESSSIAVTYHGTLHRFSLILTVQTVTEYFKAHLLFMKEMNTPFKINQVVQGWGNPLANIKDQISKGWRNVENDSDHHHTAKKKAPICHLCVPVKDRSHKGLARKCVGLAMIVEFPGRRQRNTKLDGDPDLQQRYERQLQG